MFDFHVHAGPDARPRKCDAFDLGEAAASQGMAGFALKSHTVGTAEVSSIVQRAFPRLSVVGGIALNHAVGGLNPAAVEASLRAGGRIVWFPTQDAENEYRQTGLPPAQGVTIRSAGGKLHSEVHEILAMCAERDAVLCTGHLAPDEIWLLHSAASSQGVERFVVTHPDHRHVQLEPDDQRRLAHRGALMERIIPRDEVCAVGLEELARRIAAVGTRRNLLGSDLGQPHNPHPVTGYGRFLDDLAGLGVDDEDLAFIAGELPKQLLGLDRGGRS